MRTIRMEDMNSYDIKEAINNGFTTAVFAIGSTEQHGHHLPTKTDTMIGDALAFRVAQELENALQAPTIRPGCSEHHMAFAGTISLRQSTLKSIIYDYVGSLKKSVLKAKAVSLDVGETLIALSMSAATNPTTQLAMEKLKELGGCEVHLTHIPTPGDEAGLRRLGVNITSDPNFSTNSLFVA